MELLGFEVEAQAPDAADLAHDAGRWFADVFGVVPRLAAMVGDLDAAVAELAGKGIAADPTVVTDDDEGLARAARLTGPGVTIDLVQPVPPGHYEHRVSEFIDSAADLVGPPTDDLAAAVLAILADASAAIDARLDGVADNKVLAAQLLLSQQSRGDAPDSPVYWQRSAASTLLSWFVGRGMSS